MAPFKELYRRRCTSLVGWCDEGEFDLLGPNLVYEDLEKVRDIKNRLKLSQLDKNLMPTIERGTLNFK